MSNQLQFSSIGKYVAIKLIVILALKKNGRTDFRKRCTHGQLISSVFSFLVQLFKSLHFFFFILFQISSKYKYTLAYF